MVGHEQTGATMLHRILSFSEGAGSAQ